MKKSLIGLLSLLSFSTLPYLSAAEGELGMEDVQALRDWLNTKRQVTVREIGGNLSISGEVRAEFQRTAETVNGIQQRGLSSATGLPNNAYDVEMNLMLDYRADRTWAAIKLEFDNDAGLVNGTNNKIRLEKAYFGVRLYDGEVNTLAVEVGRRPLYTMFDSKVQFVTQSDGALFRYDASVEDWGDFYVHALAEVVNDRANQYAYIAEFGWLTVMDSGLFIKYAVADWYTKPSFMGVNKLKYQFITNQWLIGYKFLPETFGKLVMPYAAFVWNPVAARTERTGYHKDNMGGYIGFTMGELRKRWDWSLDMNYQVVQPQAVPDFDSAGIGLGNAARNGFYTTSNGTPTTSANAAGSNNFRGFMITLDWLVTNNLNFQQQWLQSVTLDTSVGPFRQYKQYEIEFIYGF